MTYCHKKMGCGVKQLDPANWHVAIYALCDMHSVPAECERDSKDQNQVAGTGGPQIVGSLLLNLIASLSVPYSIMLAQKERLGGL